MMIEGSFRRPEKNSNIPCEEYCFGVRNGICIDPIKVCDHGEWLRVRQTEREKKLSSGMKLLSVKGHNCKFYLYETEKFRLLKYPRKFLCLSGIADEISGLLGDKYGKAFMKYVEEMERLGECWGHEGYGGDVRIYYFQRFERLYIIAKKGGEGWGILDPAKLGVKLKS